MLSLRWTPPLQAFPQARHSGRFYRPEWEAQLLDLQRVYAYLAKRRWFRLISEPGTFALGGEIYYVDYRLAQSQIEITFDAADQHLVCCEAGSADRKTATKRTQHRNLDGLIPVPIEFTDVPVSSPARLAVA